MTAADVVLRRPSRSRDVARHVVDRFAFPRVDDADDYEWYLNALRIVTGVVVAVRMALVVDAGRFYYDGGDSITGVVSAWETERALLVCCLALLLAIGFFTPIVIVALLSLYQSTERALGTSTLGSDVLMLVLVFFLLTNAGLRLSVDSWLSARFPRTAGGVLGALYRVIGRPSAQRLTIAAALLFYAYAILSLGAIAYHLRDDYWRSGDTIRSLLSSPYLSRIDAQIRSLDDFVPWLVVAGSIAIGIGQTVFQVFMVPLMFWTWGRRFVVVWGVAFIVTSTVALLLSYLPYVEAVLWALVFGRPRRPQRWRSPNRQCGLTARVDRPQSPVIVIAVCVLLAMGSVAIFVRAPQVRDRLVLAGVPEDLVDATWIGTFQFYSGLRAPDVFNSLDLTMGDQWWVGYRVSSDGGRTPIPFNASDGGRLGYHRNDILYFGNSLQWRRLMIFSADLEVANAPGSVGRGLILRVLRFDQRVTGDPTATHYDVEIWRNSASQVDIDRDLRFEPVLVTTFSVDRAELESVEIPRVDY